MEQYLFLNILLYLRNTVLRLIKPRQTGKHKEFSHHFLTVATRQVDCNNIYIKGSELVQAI